MKSIYYLGLNIRAKRKERKWTQPQLAEKVGVDRKAISAYETATSMPRADVLLLMAECFECSIDELFEEV